MIPYFKQLLLEATIFLSIKPALVGEFGINWLEILIGAISFYTSIDVLSPPGWVPRNEDIFYVWFRKAGITETFFDPFDVGGQQSERKKWLNCFEDAGCTIFVAALSSYDQCTAEDYNAARLRFYF